MISLCSHLTFVDFIRNLVRVNAIALTLAIIYFLYRFKKDLFKTVVEDAGKVLEQLRDEYKITNRTLLVKGGVILGIAYSACCSQHGTERIRSFHGDLPD